MEIRGRIVDVRAPCEKHHLIWVGNLGGYWTEEGDDGGYWTGTDDDVLTQLRLAAPLVVEVASDCQLAALVARLYGREVRVTLEVVQ